MVLTSKLAQWVVLSTTTAFYFDSSLVTEDTFPTTTELTSRKVDIPVLRIMPLGGSITAGSGDEPKGKENGYRKPLRDEFRHRQMQSRNLSIYINRTDPTYACGS